MICLLDMASMTYGTVVFYFLPMMIISILVIFIVVKSRFHGVLFLTGIHGTCCDAHCIGMKAY